MNWCNNKNVIIRLVIFSLLGYLNLSLAQTITDTTINKTEAVESEQEITFPHKSSLMTLGKVEGYTVAKNVESIEIEQPICVIGFDQDSLDWLRQYQDVLKSTKAICFVAEIENEVQFSYLQQMFEGVNFAITNVDWISTFMGIQHYPVLITQDQVMQ